jgi:hypothetical protein
MEFKAIQSETLTGVDEALGANDDGGDVLQPEHVQMIRKGEGVQPGMRPRSGPPRGMLLSCHPRWLCRWGSE